MAAAVRNRPLLGVADEPLFVAPEIWERLIAATQRELNALVVGPPGAGKTSLLRMLALREWSRPAVFVDLARASTAADALVLVADALGLRRPAALAESFAALAGPARRAPDRDLLEIVRALGSAPASLLLIDDPPVGDEGLRLFGRLRDELWQLDHQWVVGASPQAAGALDRPPANAFFEARLELGPLDEGRQREMLSRRLPGVGQGVIDGLVGRVERPREIVTLAREALLDGESPSDVAGRIDAIGRRLAGLSDLERTLVEHLRSRGAAYSSDPSLLSALEISQARAAQVLRKLAGDGILVAHQERHGQGRPRTVYELAPELQP